MCRKRSFSFRFGREEIIRLKDKMVMSGKWPAGERKYGIGLATLRVTGTGKESAQNGLARGEGLLDEIGGAGGAVDSSELLLAAAGVVAIRGMGEDFLN